MEVPAVQTAFLLDIGVKANLQHVTQVMPCNFSLSEQQGVDIIKSIPREHTSMRPVHQSLSSTARA